MTFQENLAQITREAVKAQKEAKMQKVMAEYAKLKEFLVEEAQKGKEEAVVVLTDWVSYPEEVVLIMRDDGLRVNPTYTNRTCYIGW